MAWLQAFVILGSLGLVVLVLSLLLSDAVDGVLDLPGDLTLPALAAGLAAFGLGGALALGPLGLLLALVVGTAAAGTVGVAATAATRSILGRDQPPVRSSDLYGVFGTVVTRIPDGGYGEVVVPQGGSRVKLAAKAGQALASGTSVYVTEVLSATSVVVAPSTPTLETRPNLETRPGQED